MPGLNKKGPMGQGAMTGRGLGLCAGADADAVDQQGDFPRGGMGRRRGAGRGRGRGRQNRFRGGGSGGGQASNVARRAAAGQSLADHESRTTLEQEVEMLRAQLESVEGQLQKLSTPE